MTKTRIMARLSELNISTRELFSILIALSALVGYVVNTSQASAKTEEAIIYISKSIDEIKSEQSEIREDVKAVNSRIDGILITLKN